MKKTMMFLGVLSLGLAHAQQNEPYEGKVGVNTHEPTATLEIKASMEDGSRKEGLLIPRMSKANLAKIADPTVSTLIYVNEATTYTAGTDVNADNRVELVDAVGFYHYNGTQWIKHLDTNTNDDEWVYEPTNKRINLRRSGGADMSNSSIFYNQHGAYINTNMLNETISFFNVNTNAVENRPPIAYDKLANNLFLKKVTPETYMELNSNTYTLMMNENLTYVEDTKDEGKAINMTSQSSRIETAATNNKNYNFLRGALNRAAHYGSGDVKYITGMVSDGRLERGKSTGYVYGGNFTASYSTDQSSNLQVGIRAINQILKSAGGRITTMKGSDIYTSITSDNQLSISNLNGVDISNNIVPKGNLTITNAIGIMYQGLDIARTTNTTVTNNYGLRIGNIKGATNNNYAIYTEKGKVSLGDELEVKSTIKVADNTDDTSCTSPKAGTIRFDATAKKFQGCTGTEWKDLHN